MWRLPLLRQPAAGRSLTLHERPCMQHSAAEQHGCREAGRSEQ